MTLYPSIDSKEYDFILIHEEEEGLKNLEKILKMPLVILEST